MSSSLILCNNNEPFLDQIVTGDKKWILYNNRWQRAQWLDWDEAPVHFSKPNLHQRKVTATVWGIAARLIHHSFLNPREIITSQKHAQQTNEIHWKLWRLQPALVNRMGPNLYEKTQQYVPQAMLQKLNELGYQVLPHLPYSLDLLPTSYHFVKHLNKFL